MQGKAIPLNPDKPNYFRPMYEEDAVELGIKAMTVGRVPPLVVNWAGNNLVSAEEYCEYMGELLGLTPKFVYTDTAYTGLLPDVTLMHQVLGKCKVHWRDGLRRTIQARYPDLPLKDA